MFPLVVVQVFGTSKLLLLVVFFWLAMVPVLVEATVIHSDTVASPELSVSVSTTMIMATAVMMMMMIIIIIIISMLMIMISLLACKPKFLVSVGQATPELAERGTQQDFTIHGLVGADCGMALTDADDHCAFFRHGAVFSYEVQAKLLS